MDAIVNLKDYYNTVQESKHCGANMKMVTMCVH